MKTLLVDGNLPQQTVIANLLEPLGFSVVPSPHPFAKSWTPPEDVALCICDGGMVDLATFIDDIRQRAAPRYIYIIALGDIENENVFATCIAAGADDVVWASGAPAIVRARLLAARRIIGYDISLRTAQSRLEQANLEIREALNAAAQAQKSLLPPPFQVIGAFDVYTAFRPADQLSAEMFALFPLGSARLGFYALNVNGNNIRAALQAVTLASTITNAVFINSVASQRPWKPDRRFMPHRLIEALSDRFDRALTHNDTLCVTCGIVDSERMEVVAAHMGRPPPLIVRQDQTVTQAGESDRATPIGRLPELHAVQAEIMPSDKIVITTSDLNSAFSSNSPVQDGRAIVRALAEESAIEHSITAAIDNWVSARPDNDIAMMVICPHQT